MSILHDLFGLNTQYDSKERLTRYYRNVFFGSQEGLEVLDDLLRELSFFSIVDHDNPAQVALSNVGKLILMKCNVWNDKNTMKILQALHAIGDEG